MKRHEQQRRLTLGFTLTEVLIAFGLLGIVSAGALSAFVMCYRMWYSTSMDLGTSREANKAMEWMVYGVGTHSGLRATKGVTYTGDTNGWTLVYTNDNEAATWFVYSVPKRTITYSVGSLIATNVAAATISSNADGVFITLRVSDARNRYASTNELTTFVELRNRPP